MEMDLYRSGDNAENRYLSLCSWLRRIEVFYENIKSHQEVIKKGLQLLNLSIDTPFRLCWGHEEKGLV